MIFLLISVFIGIILFEVPSLIRNKHWRERVVFSSLLFLAFILTSLQTVGVQLPNPSKGIDFLVRDVLHLNYK
ncbi:MAG: hypothetical protein VR66_25730 [Peptococcaceae bacterium BRH_c23]|nr:hypothetical protein [Desulfosporosinus sp. BICA1-9]KJS46389.1 MAG: hypothetical protein VR66_25730 [Peptococcaceae bacterium BRH_c23]KJS86503.1 MAG: hypothetical protein JL57_16345 [Desulfosporosinus sp. BICA1-9]HBW35597.1 hypothetical protein [Desulfosporosinus sp.]